MVLALALRMWGLLGPLPYIYHPDEPVTLGIVQTMVVDRDVNPHFFEWPSLPLYLQTAAFGGRVAVGMATGEFESADQLSLVEQQSLGNSMTEDQVSVALGRGLTALFGVGIVILAYAIALGITRRLWVAALAGILAGLEPLLVENARLLTNDTYPAFFALLAIAMSLLIYRRGALWQYAAAGAAAGAAASSKYNIALVVIVIAVAHLLRHRTSFFTERGIYIAAGTSIGVFLATSPAFVFAPAEAIHGVRTIAEHYRLGHPGAEGGSLGFYLTTLRASAGWLLLMVPLAFVPIRQRAEALILLVYPVVHLLFAARYAVRFTGTSLPAITPLLILVALGAFGVWYLADRFAPARPGVRIAVLSAVAAFVIAAGWGPVQLTLSNGRAAQIDQRLEARRWLEENVEDGAAVGVESYAPWVDATRLDVDSVVFLLRSGLPADPSLDHLVFTSTGSGRFLIAPDLYPKEVGRYGALLEDWCEVASFGGLQDVTVFSRSC